MQLFAIGQRITDFEDSVIRKTDDIAGVSLVNGAFALRHKLCGRTETHRLTLPDMQIWLVANKLPAANFAKSDTRTMIRVDVGCDLEDKTRELRLVGKHLALFCLSDSGRGSNLYETIEQLLDTEIIQCTSEKNGGNFACAISFDIERRINSGCLLYTSDAADD